MVPEGHLAPSIEMLDYGGYRHQGESSCPWSRVSVAGAQIKRDKGSNSRTESLNPNPGHDAAGWRTNQENKDGKMARISVFARPSNSKEEGCPGDGFVDSFRR